MQYINIEIKARCFHPQTVEAFLFSRNAPFAGTDYQKDIYFNVLNGRLKLRQGSIENSLIYYNRDNQKGPKQSDFYLSKVRDSSSLQTLLAEALGVKVIVEEAAYACFVLHISKTISRI